MNQAKEKVRNNVTDKSLPEQIAELIVRQVLAEELKQGDRLVEYNLAKELKVSQAPVREAFYILENKGILTRVPRKGSHIRVIDDNEIKSYIEALAGIVQLAAENITSVWNADKLASLQLLYRQSQNAAECKDIEGYVNAVDRLLTAFVSYSENIVYTRFIKEILFITNSFTQTRWTQEKIEEYNLKLTGTLEELEQNNLEEASRKFATMIRSSI